MDWLDQLEGSPTVEAPRTEVVGVVVPRFKKPRVPQMAPQDLVEVTPDGKLVVRVGDEVVDVSPRPLPKPPPGLSKQERISYSNERMEDQLADDCFKVITAAMKFAEIDDSGTPPPEWIEEYGEKEALIRYRLAVAGSMNVSEAPFALKMATQTMVAVLKARATRTAPRPLSLQLVQITAPLPAFPEKEMDHQ